MVAAAQAFVGPPALPWALDLVGSRWREPGAVLLMGASYADFFSPRCRRKKRMQLSHYRAAKGPADFQAAFLRWVVEGDGDYYDKLANLLRAAGVEPEWAVVTDLCRGSFVRWEAGGTSAKEKEVLRKHDTDFLAYVRANIEWHNSRLDEGGFHVIVALGNLVARGVREWLLDRGWSGGDHRNARVSWVRATGPSWKTIRFVSPDGRAIDVLRVPHPSRWNGLPDFSLADFAKDIQRLRWGDAALPDAGTPRAGPSRYERDDDEGRDAPSRAAYTAALADSENIERRTTVATIHGVGKKFKRLTFEKHVIDRLSMDQVFEVITSDGIYSFTKAEFFEVFPNVVNSISYRENGLYHFKPPTPRRAYRFLLPGGSAADEQPTR
jgi:hypothetical protein